MEDKKCSDPLNIGERLDLLEADQLSMNELMLKMTRKIKELLSSTEDLQKRLDNIEDGYA